MIEHDETGLLAPAEDSGALAAAMSSVLEDRSRRDRIVETATRKVEREYSRGAWLVKVCEAYKRALAGSRGGC